MELGLGVEMEISGRFLPFDIMWSWEVSGGPTSQTRLSHLRATGLTPSRSTKILSSAWLRIKGRNWKLDFGLRVTDNFIRYDNYI